jgi:hypothetical protein
MFSIQKSSRYDIYRLIIIFPAIFRSPLMLFPRTVGGFAELPLTTRRDALLVLTKYGSTIHSTSIPVYCEECRLFQRGMYLTTLDIGANAGPGSEKEQTCRTHGCRQRCERTEAPRERRW